MLAVIVIVTIKINGLKITQKNKNIVLFYTIFRGKKCSISEIIRSYYNCKKIIKKKKIQDQCFQRIRFSLLMCNLFL